MKVTIQPTKKKLSQSMHITELYKTMDISKTALITYGTFRDIILPHSINYPTGTPTETKQNYICYEQKEKYNNVIDDYLLIDISFTKDPQNNNIASGNPPEENKHD